MKIIKKISLLISLILLCGSFGLTGCVVKYEEDVPKGYSRGASAILNTRTYIYDGSNRSESIPHSREIPLYFDISHQFPELNFGMHSEKRYFLYNNDLYYIESERPSVPGYLPGFPHFQNYSVYKDGSESALGTFDKVEEKEQLYTLKCLKRSYDAIFLDGDYLYYFFRNCFSREEEWYDWYLGERVKKTVVYYKYEFHRFNLANGENEEINRKFLFGKIEPYAHHLDSELSINNKFILNKKYRE